MLRERPHHRLAAVTVAALAALAVTSCSAGDSSSTSAQARKPSSAPAAGDRNGFAASEGGAPGKGQGTDSKAGSGSSPSAVDPAVLTAGRDQLARRATVALQVKDIGQAVAQVRSAAAAAQGFVLSENIGIAPGPTPLPMPEKVSATTYGEITISVPSAKLDSVLAELGRLGHVISSTTSSEDVGSQIVDTASRLDTMRASVERVRTLLQRAKDLSQIVATEAELTRRQADLESLEAQLAALKGSVAQSPVQVSLTTEPAAAPKTHHAGGFLAGLRAGWDAFTATTTAALTVVGAVLPFAMVVLLLGLVTGWVWRRRRPGVGVTTAPDQPASAS